MTLAAKLFMLWIQPCNSSIFHLRMPSYNWVFSYTIQSALHFSVTWPESAQFHPRPGLDGTHTYPLPMNPGNSGCCLLPDSKQVQSWHLQDFIPESLQMQRHMNEQISRKPSSLNMTRAVLQSYLEGFLRPKETARSFPGPQNAFWKSFPF